MKKVFYVLTVCLAATLFFSCASTRERMRDPAAARLNTIGGSMGTAITAPQLLFTLRGTYAPWRCSFFELGLDAGLGNPSTLTYYSLYPYARYAFYLPFMDNAGWYAGAGVGVMLSQYTFENKNLYGNYSNDSAALAADIATGVNILDMINISYSLRTNFRGANSKISVGYTHRFK
ncbi:MAG: hypothetical protein LBG95_08640 [Treponema sp.]|jgi:hypothetical protein|nr:hypothetical protein [Treponema sp.]